MLAPDRRALCAVPLDSDQSDPPALVLGQNSFVRHSKIECRMSALGQKRTLVERVVMSALCQKQTFRAAAETLLFDHLVGASKQRRRYGEGECFCRLYIDQVLELSAPAST